jgi:hypothetical protein
MLNYVELFSRIIDRSSLHWVGYLSWPLPAKKRMLIMMHWWYNLDLLNRLCSIIGVADAHAPLSPGGLGRLLQATVGPRHKARWTKYHSTTRVSRYINSGDVTGHLKHVHQCLRVWLGRNHSMRTFRAQFSKFPGMSKSLIFSAPFAKNVQVLLIRRRAAQLVCQRCYLGEFSCSFCKVEVIWSTHRAE